MESNPGPFIFSPYLPVDTRLQPHNYSVSHDINTFVKGMRYTESRNNKHTIANADRTVMDK